MEKFDFVVIGGGIAGICCAENLCNQNEDKTIAVVTSSPLIKKVVNYKKLGRLIDDFDVAEAEAESIEHEFPRLKVMLDDVTQLNAANHSLTLSSGKILTYGKVCICAGARPKVGFSKRTMNLQHVFVTTIQLISQENPYVIGIRDTDSAKNFQAKVQSARRVVIVGNGGIAMEIAYEITGCEVTWVVREQSINVVFLDAGAAQFVLSRLQNIPVKDVVSKRSKYTAASTLPNPTFHRSAALGPDWHENFTLTSSLKTCDKKINIEYGCEVAEVLTDIPENEKEQLGSWPVYLRLTNSKIIGADVIVSATGVRPDPGIFLRGNNLKISDVDGGLVVNSEMQTSEPDVYAAGDVCTPGWEYPPKWVHMRLWSQARILGVRAAECMTAHSNSNSAMAAPVDLDIAMELFTHVTRFCGFKVILLGLFNGQRLPHCDVLLRVRRDVEYVKAVVADGRLQGALLIGETDLEETFENLLLNDTDISAYGDSLLDPNIDLEDYFD